MVAPYSGDMFAMVARSASVKLWHPVPKNLLPRTALGGSSELLLLRADGCKVS